MLLEPCSYFSNIYMCEGRWVVWWVREWVSEWVSGWASELASKWVCEWVIDWVNEWVSELEGWESGCGWDVGGWVRDWVNEWVSERASERANKRSRKWTCEHTNVMLFIYSFDTCKRKKLVHVWRVICEYIPLSVLFICLEVVRNCVPYSHFYMLFFFYFDIFIIVFYCLVSSHKKTTYSWCHRRYTVRWLYLFTVK